MRVFVARFEFDRGEADEVVGDVFEVAFAHISQLAEREPNEVRNWLLRTARYLAANRGRRNATRRRAVQRLRREPESFAASSEDEFLYELDEHESTELRKVALECLGDLTSEERRLLIMHANGSTGPQISEVFGTTPGAARQRVSRARAAFRVAFEARSGISLEREGGK